MNIRQARKDEVKKLQDINDDAFANNPKYDPDLVLDWAQSEKGKAYFTNLLNDSNDVCFVAEDGDKLVGYIAASPKPIAHRKSKYIEIENLGVAQAYQRKGVGSLLMEKCLEWAKERGYEKVYLSSYFANTQAIDFYKKNGFSEIELSLEKSI